MKPFITIFQNIIATLFSNTDLSEKMQTVFKLLAQYFPLQAITFDQFDAENRCLNIMSVTTADNFYHADISVPLNMTSAIFITRIIAARKVALMCDTSTALVARAHAQALAQFFPSEARAYMAAPLIVDSEVLGVIVLIGTAPHCFNRKHEQLLGMLMGPFALSLSNTIQTQDIAAEKEKIAKEKRILERHANFLSSNILVGSGGGLKKVVEAIQQLEDMESPVLILGETGTGKELVAAAIQKSSRRKNEPFVKVNCGAIPETLLDSELFGHEKGAFTGASNLRVGRFEQAHGGTLFLDEVGELSLHAQVHLLRVLQDGIVQRIGGTRSIRVNVRIIAATNRDLAEMRRQGLFREDLFHRLHVFPIAVPPLRERLEDIPLLVKHFIDKTALRLNISAPKLFTESLPSLSNYAWPGNVRELENLVERAFILNPAGPLDLEQFLPPSLRPTVPPILNTDDPLLRSIIDERVALALAALQVPSYIPHAASPSFTPSGNFMLSAVCAPSQIPPPSPMPSTAGSTSPVEASAPPSLADSMRQHIEAALEHCHGKVYGSYGAAEYLQINHNTLRARMRKLGIDPKFFARKKTDKKGKDCSLNVRRVDKS